MKGDEALICLCSELLSTPTQFPVQRDKHSTQWRAQSASTLSPLVSVLIQELPSTPPLSIPYLSFAEPPPGTHYTKISTCSLIAQQGGSTIALQLHIVLSDRQRRAQRAVETNILITHGHEGIRGGLAQVSESLPLSDVVC